MAHRVRPTQGWAAQGWARTIGEALVIAVLLALVPSANVWAWGATGHRVVGTLAVAALPDELPAFLRAPDAIWQIGEVGREPDRLKGAGLAYDYDHSPGHYVNVGDDFLIAGGPRLMALPETRMAYDSALRALGANQYAIGFLPYSIVESWLQLRKDFAYWRADAAGARTAATAEDRAWLDNDRRLRELLIVRDLGFLAHFVGDGSQPMHVSVHLNGWGDYPNPQGYSQEKLHARLEGEFVRRHVTTEDVMAKLHGYWPCGCPIERRTALYLAATLRTVEPLYALEKAGGFSGDAAAGKAFIVERLAAAVGELRDLVIDAWRASADGTVGWPPVAVRDVEAGTVMPLDRLIGLD